MFSEYVAGTKSYFIEKLLSFIFLLAFRYHNLLQKFTSRNFSDVSIVSTELRKIPKAWLFSIDLIPSWI